MGPQGRPDYSATVLRYTVDGAAPMYYYRRVAVLIAYSYYFGVCVAQHMMYWRGRAARDPSWAVPVVYGDSMILAVCIFSQSATGEVSCAYFRRYLGVGSANFRKQTGPTRAYAVTR